MPKLTNTYHSNKSTTNHPVFEADGKRLALDRVLDDWGCKARDLGRLLGYAADGGKLVDKIGGAWKDEFVEGVDFVREAITDSVIARTSALLLTRSGINLVCILTRKPLGREIRRWLASDVMIQIADSGSYGSTLTTRETDLSALVDQVTRQSAAIEQLAREVAALRTQAPALPAPKLSDGVHPFGPSWSWTSERGDVHTLQARVRIKGGIPFEVYVGRIIPDDGYLEAVATDFAKAFPGHNLTPDWRSARGWGYDWSSNTWVAGYEPPPDGVGMSAQARHGQAEPPARVIDDASGRAVAVEWKGNHSQSDLQAMSAELRRLRYDAGPWKRVRGGYRAELH
jgi:prophage antirepressor-like protein